MSLDTDLRTELIAGSTTLGQRVHQDVVPQQQAKLFPRCWLSRSSTEQLVDLDGSKTGDVDLEFDAEFISDDSDQSKTAADSARNYLNGKYGTFGSSSIKGCLVNDQSDDYVPRGIGDDTGLYVTALRIRIVST